MRRAFGALCRNAAAPWRSGGHPASQAAEAGASARAGSSCRGLSSSPAAIGR
eukprot:CAMPEP_0182889976 /NCGR_PEP_ID=MMETSP0034_2-20130328/22372_1 /TAXON_ID=156128 /ORGANISM="Nephroselmis pyriformis, Strain CCMP717" /LENGTH=51 /DNA_ID=CAMNT_0025023503 /DNA_START=51 /DNA_END=202 /DNA_ORIENTATION=-